MRVKENPDACERGSNDGEVSLSRTCIGEPPPDPLGGDHSAGPWQRTRAVGEGGPTHPQRTASTTEMENWNCMVARGPL